MTARDGEGPARSDGFADALRAAIVERGLSLDRLRYHLRARGHELSIATLSYWQSGRSRPERASSLTALGALEDILLVPEGSLLRLLPPTRTPVTDGAALQLFDAEDQQVEMLLVAHLLGEVGDHVGVVDIAALGGDRHQQMVAHQPGDQSALVAIQPVQLAELQRIHGPEFGMIATPALGDVVEEGGDAEQLGLAQLGEHLVAERVSLAAGRIRKAMDVLQQPMGVLVYRVGVEHVELHLADDEVPLGQVGREDPVLVHQGERLADAVGVAQERHEETAALG